MATALGAINFTGFVDGFYAYNFRHPTVVTPSVPLGNPPTFPIAATNATLPVISSFRAWEGPDRQFGLNMAELVINKAPDADNRLGFNLAFGFGNAMNVVNSTEAGSLGFSQYLKEGYMSYNAPIGKGLQIDFGKFVTRTIGTIAAASCSPTPSRFITTVLVPNTPSTTRLRLPATQSTGGTTLLRTIPARPSVSAWQ